MVDKDLLNKMLEMRRMNMTYKQIAEATDKSISFVGKVMKEVRDNPDLSINFIELTNFETGQTVLSFTPENFEKYRTSNNLYYLDLQVFEFKDGLIHSTNFEQYKSAGTTNPLPEWYVDVTKLYGKQWNQNLLTEAVESANLSLLLGKVERLRLQRLNEGDFMDSFSIDYPSEENIQIRHWDAIFSVLSNINRELYMNLKNRTNAVNRRHSDKHWLRDADLVKTVEELAKDIDNYFKNRESYASMATYLLKFAFGEECSLLYLYDISHSVDLGWNLKPNPRNPGSNDYADWRYCVENNISREDWLEMKKFQFKDYHHYLEFKDWIKIDCDWDFINAVFDYTEGADVADEWEYGWEQNIIKGNLDEIISLLESNGWSISLLETGAELVDCYDLTIDYVIGEMGISKLKSAAASIKYCEKNNLEFLEENIAWFKDHDWKIPKLNKGFTSYIGSHIFNLINDDERNYVPLSEYELVFLNSPQPKNKNTGQNFRDFIYTEIKCKPFTEIGLRHRMNGMDIFVKKPAEPIILDALYESGLTLEELFTVDVNKASSVYNYFKEKSIPFGTEIAAWAISKDWEIPMLGGFRNYREQRLYERILQFDVPAIRLDKLLPEFNQFEEPGPTISSEQELHNILESSPFNQICKSSEEAGMLFLDDSTNVGSKSPIIQDKIVIKEVIVEKEVLVEKVEYVEDKTPLFDINEYQKISKSKNSYAKRAIKSINNGDLLESITSVWRLFRIEAEKFVGNSKKTGDNFNVELIDKFAEKVKLNDRLHKKLHQLRRARNDFDKGKSESPIKPTSSLVKAGLQAIEMII